ncbi:hypothetical protein [Hanstruepera marina]|uniref:hypothetical protein n=1 Tax=Hanstruepera marina TaxID=2873265 RepID=UPI001CA64860|nr:hypothetical protein [Hanstruepera marina]
MVLNNIEKLLEKYENGETTLLEEQQLKSYFSQETVAPHLEMYKPIFAYFLVNEKEQFTKDVPLKTKRTFNYTWISVAAVAVLFFGFYFGSPFLQEPSKEEQQMAFNQFKEAMQMVSSNLNKGTSSIGYLESMGKGTESVNYLDELNNPIQRIFK